MRCRVRGLSPPGVLAFTVPIRLGIHSTCWDTPWCQSGFSATLPGGTDATLDAGQVHLIVLVNLSLLGSHLPVEFATSLEQAASDHLLPAALTDVQRFGQWLLALLENKTNWQPRLDQYPAAVRSLEEDLDRLARECCPSGDFPKRRPVMIYQDVAQDLTAHSNTSVQQTCHQ